MLETPDSSTGWGCTNNTIITYTCTQLTDVQSCLLKDIPLVCFVLFISTLGLLGNGTVFWLLGFCMKRNFFSVYVLNLAAADFGVLTAVWSLYICAWSYTDSKLDTWSKAYNFLIYLFFFMQCSSIHFLTAISVARCLVIFFPIWHRCRRPKNLSSIASSILWGISCIYLGMIISCWKGTDPTVIAVFLIFVSVMVISTAILFFKVCCNARIRQYGRVHVAILLSLIFFIVTIIPISLFVKYHGGTGSVASIVLLFTSMNSCINPFIYFIFGRYRSFDQSRVSIKDVLWRFLKEDETSGNEAQNSSVRSPLNKIRSDSVLISRIGGSLPESPAEELQIN